MTNHYLYTIFDSTSRGDTAWPTQSQVELEASSDVEAMATLLGILNDAIKSCSRADGYCPGQYICATLWGEEGPVVGRVSLQLTENLK